MPGRRTQRRRAIVLGRTKLGEQDVILTTLAHEGDQLRVVAKGARKPGARLAARTELFCDVDMLVSVGRGLGIVSEAQLVEPHAGLRDEISSIAAASAMCEVARLTSYEDVPDPYLHPILSRALQAAEQAEDHAHLGLVVAAYVMKVLAHGGWRPELQQCISCGEDSLTRFSVHAGGVLCESCAKDVSGAEPILGQQLGWLRALLGCTFDELLASTVDDATATYVLTVSHAWASAHLESRLRAVEFFAGL